MLKVKIWQVSVKQKVNSKQQILDSSSATSSVITLWSTLSQVMKKVRTRHLKRRKMSSQLINLTAAVALKRKKMLKLQRNKMWRPQQVDEAAAAAMLVKKLLSMIIRTRLMTMMILTVKMSQNSNLQQLRLKLNPKSSTKRIRSSKRLKKTKMMMRNQVRMKTKNKWARRTKAVTKTRLESGTSTASCARTVVMLSAVMDAPMSLI